MWWFGENKTVADAKLKQEQDTENPVVLEDKWLIRDCDVYEDEYDECTSVRGRFQQYFIYGETQDCNQWKKDYENCRKWVQNNDIKAAEAVITSEKERRLQRLRGHYGNNIWQRRDSPPADWNKPLPEWIVKRDQNSYLAQKAQEIREGKEVEEVRNGFCSIM